MRHLEEEVRETKPKFIIAAFDKASYVFMNGKCISEGLKNLSYHARDEQGNLRPMISADIDIQSFSFEGMTFEEFWEKINNIREDQSGAKPQKD